VREILSGENVAVVVVVVVVKKIVYTSRFVRVILAQGPC